MKYKPLKIRRNGEHFYSEDWTSSTTFYTIKNKEEFAFYESKNKINNSIRYQK